ncbi:hypothetical protein [Hamadaea tsunoensis]|uniref:hypothetical protein n=1 Tax=Hamadaea tsunoensis TaxID=53368 RepID=UPI0003F5A149|nr:hypothetical protein [Hamadaea tsunoensis]
MEPVSPAVSRRGLLTAAATAGSVLVLTAPARASAHVSTVPAEFREHDRIATVVTQSPAGLPVAHTYAADFHDRLGDWIRMWWASAPSAWIAPFHVITSGTAQGGHALLLNGIGYTRAGKSQLGFDAAVRDSRYWATVASLYRHFPSVTARAGHLEISDGQAGFTGSSEQIGFVRASLTQVWGQAQAPSDIAGRTGWNAFTEATARQGLSNHHSL